MTGGGTAPKIETIYSGGTGGVSRPPLAVDRGDTSTRGLTARLAQEKLADQGARTITGYKVGNETFKTAAEAQAAAQKYTSGGTSSGGTGGFDGASNPYRTSSSEFTADPGYKFRLQEGLNAVEGSAAAAGGLYSGATMQALNTRAANEADQTYGDWYSRYTTEKNNYLGMLSGLASNGQNAASGQNAGGQAYTQNASSAGRVGLAGTMAGYQGQTNAVQGTINDMAGIYGYWGDQGANNPMSAYASSKNTVTRPKANPFY
jgi:hypothetical protein